MTNQEAMMPFEEPISTNVALNNIITPLLGQAYDKGHQAATAQLTPALVEAREALRKAAKQLRILIPETRMVNDERMAFMKIAESLATLNSILGEW